jgi:hypothetical protein
MTFTPNEWAAVGSFATALTVAAAAVQIYYATRQEKTEFEDSLVREYRQLLAELPPYVLRADRSCPEQLPDDDFRTFYRYLDLSNEQVFLRKKCRIRKDTWKEWSSGIASNLSKPGFDHAWREAKKNSAFLELRCLVEADYADPRSRRWRTQMKRIEAEHAVSAKSTGG